MHKQVQHFFTIITLIIFYVVNCIYTIVRNLIWWRNGIIGEVRQRQKNWASIAQHAHKMKIVIPYIIDPLYPVYESNFIMTHDGFVEPEYVLRDDVTLLQVTHNEALFVQQDPSMAPAFSSKYNFATIGQIMTARYIIKMPIDSFLKLAEELECEEEKIVLIHNIGRCGGTLLTSVFDHTGRAVAWSEPRVLDNVMRLANFAWDRKTSRRLIRCTLKMLAKPYHGFSESTLAYVLKVATFLNGDNEVLCNAVPKAKHIFMYRDLNVAAHSGQRVLWFVPCLFLLYISRWFRNPQSIPFFYHAVGTRSRGCDDISYRFEVFLEYAYRLQIISFVAFNRMRESGIPVIGLLYEDLVNDPDRVISELLKATDMPETLTSKAKKALEFDSQAIQPFNQKEMAKFRKWMGERDPNEELLRDEMQEISEELGLQGPRDWEKEVTRLPGTI